MLSSTATPLTASTCSKVTQAIISDKEADINARNVNGCTPLHFAVKSENINMVKIVLKYGGDPNAKVNLPLI